MLFATYLTHPLIHPFHHKWRVQRNSYHTLIDENSPPPRAYLDRTRLHLPFNSQQANNNPNELRNDFLHILFICEMHRRHTLLIAVVNFIDLWSQDHLLSIWWLNLWKRFIRVGGWNTVVEILLAEFQNFISKTKIRVAFITDTSVNSTLLRFIHTTQCRMTYSRTPFPTLIYVL